MYVIMVEGDERERSNWDLLVEKKGNSKWRNNCYGGWGVEIEGKGRIRGEG